MHSAVVAPLIVAVGALTPTAAGQTINAVQENEKTIRVTTST